MAEKQSEENKGLINVSSEEIYKPAETPNRDKFYDNLTVDKDRYDKFEVTPEQREEVLKTYRRYSTGLSATVPLYCSGINCPFADTCPYEQQGIAPEGEPCKVEYDMGIFYTRQFMEEFDVDPNNYTEVILISELVELLIYETRTNKILAKAENAEFTKLVPVLTAAGDKVEEERIHNAWLIKERIKTRRMKILEALTATRKEKLKAAKMLDDSDKAATVTRTLVDLKKRLDELKNPAEEVPYEEVKNGKNKR